MYLGYDELQRVKLLVKMTIQPIPADNKPSTCRVSLCSPEQPVLYEQFVLCIPVRPNSTTVLTLA